MFVVPVLKKIYHTSVKSKKEMGDGSQPIVWGYLFVQPIAVFQFFFVLLQLETVNLLQLVIGETTLFETESVEQLLHKTIHRFKALEKPHADSTCWSKRFKCNKKFSLYM